MIYSIQDIQTFFSETLPTLTDSDFSDPKQKDIDKNVITSLYTLIQLFNSNHGKLVNIEKDARIGTTNAYGILVSTIDKTNSSSQQDAQELFQKIFASLINYTPSNTSIVEKFNINIKKTVNCATKGPQTTTATEPLLLIDITSSKSNNIQSLLEEYQQVTIPDAANNQLDACGDRKKDIKDLGGKVTTVNKGIATSFQYSLKIPTTTKYVIIGLKRFAFVTGSDIVGSKLNNEITPEKIITIDGVKFQINGCICHGGGTGGGHYWYILFKKDGRSMKLNDSADPIITEKERIDTVLNSLKVDGYIYLYKRVSTVGAPVPSTAAVTAAATPPPPSQ
jgi:uncharacterized UBP type Zn finger protein